MTTACRTSRASRIGTTVRTKRRSRSCRTTDAPIVKGSRWIGSGLLAAALVSLAGPFDIPLFNTPKAPDAKGQARLVFAPSPFGVAVTADGRASYDVQITASGLPEPSSLGGYSAYVAWAVTTDLKQWNRLGTVSNGESTVGHAELNKFLLVITAESIADTEGARRSNGVARHVAERVAAIVPVASAVPRNSAVRRPVERWLATALLVVIHASFASAQTPPKPAPKPNTMPGMPGMGSMPGMKTDSSKAKRAPARSAAPRTTRWRWTCRCRVPMPKGMPMIPGLVGLTPPVATFLPGERVDVKRLPAAKPSQVARLKDGDTLDLTAMLVRRTIKGHAFAMYGFNGQVPGPLIRVPQNATITVRFHNRIDLPSTVHWHGVRLDNRFDGVPGLTQDSVNVGGDYAYTVHFPDAGIYWYHPHVREDIQQAMGLFGNLRVDSPDRDYYSPVNREETLLLDDILVNGDTLIPFGKDAPDYALMGRVGNVLLVNGEQQYAWLSCVLLLPSSPKSRPWATRVPLDRDELSPWTPRGSKVPTMSQYDAATNLIRSRSRSTTRRVAT